MMLSGPGTCISDLASLGLTPHLKKINPMTQEDSQRLIHRIHRKEQEFGLLLICACLCAGVLISMVFI